MAIWTDSTHVAKPDSGDSMESSGGQDSDSEAFWVHFNLIFFAVRRREASETIYCYRASER